MAVSRLGISSIEFYQLSPVEFYYAMDDNSNREAAHFKIVYESMRLQTWFLLNVQLSKKDRIKSPEKLLKFAWDEEEKAKPIKKQSVEEMKRVLKGIVKQFKK